MMHKAIRHTFTACLLLALTACGSRSDKAPLPLNKPAAETRTATLALRWQADTGTMTPLHQPALTENGAHVCTISRDGQVQIRSTADGSEQHTDTLLAEKEITAAAGCSEDIVAAVSAAGVLHVHDIAQGLLWTRPLHSRSYAAPLLADGKLFVLGLDGRLLATTQRQGHELWHYISPRKAHLRTPLQSVPVLAGNVLYVGVNSGILIALDPANGRVLWENTVTLPDGSNAVANILDVTTPAVRRASVCATAYQGGVACFARQSGKRLWHKPLSTQVPAALDDAGEMLVTSDNNGVLSAFRASDGEVLWRTPTVRQLSAPLVSGGLVLAGDDSGRVYAFFADNGNYAASLQVGDSAVLTLQALPGGGILALLQSGRLARLQVDR